jgi:hypothetical protein
MLKKYFQTTIENLQLVLDANKKEENAVEALRVELDRKSQEKSEIVNNCIVNVINLFFNLLNYLQLFW